MQIKEGIIKKYHPHPIGSLGFYLCGFLCILAGLIFESIWPVAVLGFLIIFLGEIVRRAETFYILETGVAREYNFLSTSRKFAEYEKIQNLEVYQSLLDNILGIGNVKFDTAGVDKIEVNFYLVKNPYKIEHIVREKMSLK